MVQSASFGKLIGPAKHDAVKRLLDKLAGDLESDSLGPQSRESILEELKIYGRDPNYADPIFTEYGIQTLVRHAFDSTSVDTSRGALRILCNALLLKPETRQRFVDTGYAAKASERLKNDNPDDEFLVSRLLLISTYNTNIDLPKLIAQHGLAESIVSHLARHAKELSSPTGRSTPLNAMEFMALEETLKLAFNVSQFCPNHLASFEPAIPHIITILCSLSLPSPQNKTPLGPPFGPAVNAVLNLDLSTPTAKEHLYPATSPSSFSDRLIELLALSVKAYKNPDLEQTVTPLVCALSLVYEHAPALVKQSIQSALLPTEKDREDALGKADTLHGHLLQNWSNPEAPELGKAIAHLYFDLSDKDPHKFVKNVGYGYASGFLFQNNISFTPEELSKGGETEVEGEDGVREIRRPVNPITGQFLDTERVSELPEMTDEEKEREAERLFVLFERLKQTGIIDVQNPVEQAMREGRFEELPDDK
ncbi:guanine nucleotide exchange factor [Triangularia verruculosa]|uniref:Guanine nucleotide exchange factor n=1 Tax=Triangularia verruculosa TaxID=2587418 RepID=A0AAN6X6M9_9PEZI|nr:guanine nucleotide exchange factor [Triangularia verruculosa]